MMQTKGTDYPYFRQDIEGFADVAEEVARFHGYDKIPNPHFPAGKPPQESFLQAAH